MIVGLSVISSVDFEMSLLSFSSLPLCRQPNNPIEKNIEDKIKLIFSISSLPFIN